MLLIGLVCSMVAPVLADVVISFNPVGMDPDNLQIYNSSGYLMGNYNTSSQALHFTNDSAYSILVVPANDNLLGNHPSTWFDNFVNKLQQNAIPIVLILFMIGIVIAALSRRR